MCKPESKAHYINHNSVSISPHQYTTSWFIITIIILILMITIMIMTIIINIIVIIVVDDHDDIFIVIITIKIISVMVLVMVFTNSQPNVSEVLHSTPITIKANWLEQGPPLLKIVAKSTLRLCNYFYIKWWDVGLPIHTLISIAVHWNRRWGYGMDE